MRVVVGVRSEVWRNSRGWLLGEVGVPRSGGKVVVGGLDGCQSGGQRLLRLVRRGEGAIGASAVDRAQGTALTVG